MYQSLDRLERLLDIATEEGIAVRREWLSGVRGGLVRVGRTPILFVDESLSDAEQLDQVRNSLELLDWTESQWWDEISLLLEFGHSESQEN